MRRLPLLVLFLIITLSSAKAPPEPELPLCPINVNFLPQNLPMHCRMPPDFNANVQMPRLPRLPDMPNMPNIPNMPDMFNNPTLPPDFYQSPPPNKQPQPYPFPIPPGLPSPIFPPGLPGAPSVVPAPIPLPMPMPIPGPAHKLPVIVMPFYAPDPTYKKPERRKKHPDRRIEIHTLRPHYSDTSSSSDTDAGSSSDTSSDSSRYHSDKGWWKGNKDFRRSNRRANAKPHKRRRHRRRQIRRKNDNQDLLTPIIQYVTNDGYVIFEKEISKDEAKDWLQDKNKEVIQENKNKVTHKEIADMIEDELNNMHKDEELMDAPLNRSDKFNRMETTEKAEITTQRAPMKKQIRRRHKAIRLALQPAEKPDP